MPNSHPLEMSVRMDFIPGRFDIFAMTPTLVAVDGSNNQDPIRLLYEFRYDFAILDEWVHYEFTELDEHSDDYRLRLARLTNFPIIQFRLVRV